MKVIVLLHEIYGVNPFLDDQRRKYEDLGYFVSCPDLYVGKVFGYGEAEAAYRYFYAHVGLDAYGKVWKLTAELKRRYEAVYLLGFSVGATLAWRCSENPACDGVIACYGSRIRDYPRVVPKAPALLLLAEKDSFDPAALARTLAHTPNTRIRIFPGEHGFLDPYGGHFRPESAREAEEEMLRFLTEERSVSQDGAAR